MIEPESGDFGVFYCRANGVLHSPPGYSVSSAIADDNKRKKSAESVHASRTVSLLDGNLFEQCLHFISRNSDLIDSLRGLPDYIGEVIFEQMLKSGCFEDSSYAPKLIALFDEAFSNCFLRSLHCTNQERLTSIKSLELQSFRSLIKIDLSENSLDDDSPLLASVWTIPTLQILALRNNNISDVGLRKYSSPFRMLKNGPFQLEYLDLSHNVLISSQCLQYLTAFSQLTFVNLTGTRVEHDDKVRKFERATGMHSTGGKDSLIRRYEFSSSEGWAVDLLDSWMCALKKEETSLSSKSSNFYGGNIKARHGQDKRKRMDEVSLLREKRLKMSRPLNKGFYFYNWSFFGVSVCNNTTNDAPDLSKAPLTHSKKLTAALIPNKENNSCSGSEDEDLIKMYTSQFAKTTARTVSLTALQDLWCLPFRYLLISRVRNVVNMGNLEPSLGFMHDKNLVVFNGERRIWLRNSEGWSSCNQWAIKSAMNKRCRIGVFGQHRTGNMESKNVIISANSLACRTQVTMTKMIVAKREVEEEEESLKRQREANQDKRRAWRHYEKKDDKAFDHQQMLPSNPNKFCVDNINERMKAFARRKNVLSPGVRSKYSGAMDSRSESSQSEDDEGAFDRFKERITINVGGFKHETFRSTLRNFPDTRLAWIADNSSNNYDGYDPVKKEYFFDRHPGVFAQILNYYRTGRLHTPVDVCGPLFEEELQFWGLDEQQMEPCCWAKYTEHRDAQENLRVFDEDDVNNDEDAINMMQSEDSTPEQNSRSLHPLQPSLKRFKMPIFKSRGWRTFKLKTWLLFEDPRSSVWAKAMVFISLSFIILSVLSLCFNSVIALAKRQEKDVMIFDKLLLALDIICCVWFSMEFVLRLTVCPNKIKFFMSLMNWIDLISVVPYYVHFVLRGSEKDSTIEAVEIVSATRLLRLFRFFRLSTGLQILKHTMIASSKELLLLLLLMMIPVAIFSTIVYHCERKVSGTEFRTIPESFWWAIITITTVGYGDMSPSTTFGKVFGAFCATMSVLILALPVSIIGNNFSLFYSYAQARLKLPKKEHHALVGAANVLVAEASQAQTSPDLDDPDPGSRRMSEAEARRSLGFIDANITVSKRYRRERLSLFAGGVIRPPPKPSRAKSMGNALSVNSNLSGDDEDDKDDEKPAIPNGILVNHDTINQSNDTQMTDAGSLSGAENGQDDTCSRESNEFKDDRETSSLNGNAFSTSPTMPIRNGGLPLSKPPSGKKKHLIPPHKVHPTITLTPDGKGKNGTPGDEKDPDSPESMESIPLTLRNAQGLSIHNIPPSNGHVSTPPSSRSSSKSNTSPKLSSSPKLSPSPKQNGRVYMETVAEVTVDSPRNDENDTGGQGGGSTLNQISHNCLEVPDIGSNTVCNIPANDYDKRQLLEES